MLVFSGTTLFFGTTVLLARLFFFGTTFFRHDFLSQHDWHDFLFSARFFFFRHRDPFFGTTFCFGATVFFRHDFFYSTLTGHRWPIAVSFDQKFKTEATGCLKCRFLLFLLLISFSTCTGVLPEKMQGVTGRTSIPEWNLVLTFYILALTSMSFRDFPFL